MYSHAYSFFFHKSSRALFFKLTVVSLLGCLLGIAAAVSSLEISVPLMRFAVSGEVSIVCKLQAVLLPFLILLISVASRCHWLFYLVCGVSSFLYTYCVFLVNAVYGTANWIVSLCVLFSGAFCTMLIYLAALRFCGRKGEHVSADLIRYAEIAVLICLLDCWIVFPFWNSVINS